MAAPGLSGLVLTLSISLISQLPFRHLNSCTLEARGSQELLEPKATFFFGTTVGHLWEAVYVNCHLLVAAGGVLMPTLLPPSPAWLGLKRQG